MTDENNDINTARLVNIENLSIGGGSYRILLGVNVLGVCLCMFTFWLFAMENRSGEDIMRQPIWVGPGYQRFLDACNEASQGTFKFVAGDENVECTTDDDELEKKKAFDNSNIISPNTIDILQKDTL